MSIFSQLKKIAKGYSYHTPGHKGKLCSLDGTEIEDIFPGDRIERAQARLHGISAQKTCDFSSTVRASA